MEACQPKSGFIVIVNSSGDVVDHLPSNSNFEEIKDLLRYLDCYFPNASPHSSWTCNGSFKKLD